MSFPVVMPSNDATPPNPLGSFGLPAHLTANTVDVSVVVPAYNAQATLSKTIYSIWAQTLQPREIIIVNDGSSDHTAAVAQALTQFDSRIRVISQANAGVAIARQTGFDASTGTFVAFLDSDDLWMPRFIEASLQAVARASQPECIVFSRYYAVDEAGYFMLESPRFDFAGPSVEGLIANASVILPSTAFLHRAVVEDVGGFSPFHLYYHEDRIFFIKAFSQFPAYATGETLTVYQQSRQGKARRKMVEYDQMVHINDKMIAACGIFLTPNQKRLLALTENRTLLYSFATYGFMDNARRLLREGFTPEERPVLTQGVKGRLLALSLLTGVNWLILGRQGVQWFWRTVGHTWWQCQRLPLLPVLQMPIPSIQQAAVAVPDTVPVS